MPSPEFNQPARRLITGIPFGLVLVCFLLPFMTLTTWSCDGTTLATMHVTGTDLLRGRPGPAHTSNGGTTADVGDLVSEARDLRDFALAAFAAALAGLLAVVLPGRRWARLSLVSAVVCFWLLLVLCVPASQIGSGLAIAVPLSLTGMAFAWAAAYSARRRPEEGTAVAGFAMRLAGWFVDATLIACGLLVAGKALALVGAPGPWNALALIGLVVLYRAVLEWSPVQATVGERGVGVRVTDVEGHRLSAPRALVRAVCELGFLVALLGVGHVAAAFTRDRRALHDVVASTVVLKRL